MRTTIEQDTIGYLQDLATNNDREWFKEHRPRYDAARANWKAFAQDLLMAMQEVDQVTDHKIWRINRDIRFSMDKTPYNTHFSVGLTRKKPQLRGGYYFRTTGADGMVAGGFFGPEKQDLKRIRQEIDRDDAPFRTALSTTSLVDTFGQLTGEQVKTAPRGYKKEHAAIDLLRYKQFLLRRRIPLQDLTSTNLIDQLVTDYLAMRPFFDLMTEILTTDENGVPLW